MGKRTVRVTLVAIACLGVLSGIILGGCQSRTAPPAPSTATGPVLVAERQSIPEAKSLVAPATPTAIPLSGAALSVLEPYTEAELAAFEQEGFGSPPAGAGEFGCHPPDASLAAGPDLSEDGGFIPSTVGEPTLSAGLPAGRASTAGERPLGRFTTLTVRTGDTLSGLAGVFGVSTDTVRWANGLDGESDDLLVGQVLTILPVSGVLHEVESGDTVAGIAAAYGVAPNAIVEANRLADPGLVGEGTVLIVPGGKPLTGTR